MTAALSLLVGTAIAALLLWRDARADAEEEVRRVVRLLAQHAARTLEPVDAALLATQRALQDEGFGRRPITPERLHELARLRADMGSQLLRLAVTDAQADILALSDRPLLQQRRQVDDPWFAELAEQRPTGLTLHPQRTSRFGAKQVVPAVRVITAPGSGEFLGLVIGALDVDALKGFHDSARPGRDWELELLRSDGVALTRPGDDFWTSPMNALPAAAEETLRWQPRGDGEVLLGLRRVGAWPLVAAVAVSGKAAAAQWRQQAATLASLASLALAGIGGLTWLGVLLAQRARGMSQTLDLTEARYRSLVQSSPDGIVLARDGRIEYANPAMLALADAARPSDLAGRRVDEILDGINPHQRSDDPDGAAQPGLVRIEHSLRPLKGAPRDVETLIATAAPGDDPALQIVVRDISQRKAAEQALRDSDERHRAMVEGAPDCAFLLVDTEGRIEDLGAAAGGGVLGPAPGASREWRGQPLATLFEPEAVAAGEPQRLLDTAAGPDRRAEREGWCRRGDGTRFWADLVIAALQGSQGALRGFHVQLRDASARLRLQQQLQTSRHEVEALAMAAENAREHEKRRIARELHDELGQVLTVQQLEMEMLSAEAAQHWPAMVPRIDAMHSRIEDAIAVTRRISGDLRPLVLDDLGLAAALEWLVGQAGTRKGVSGRLHVQGDVSRVSDEVATTLFRIAQESVTNVLRHAAARHLTVNLSVDGDGARLTVTDDGRGIDRSARRRGLGLRGIEERVRLLGGQVSIAPAPGRGTRVEVRLPLVVSHADTIEPALTDPST